MTFSIFNVQAKSLLQTTVQVNIIKLLIKLTCCRFGTPELLEPLLSEGWTSVSLYFSTPCLTDWRSFPYSLCFRISTEERQIEAPGVSVS